MITRLNNYFIPRCLTFSVSASAYYDSKNNGTCTHAKNVKKNFARKSISCFFLVLQWVLQCWARSTSGSLETGRGLPSIFRRSEDGNGARLVPREEWRDPHLQKHAFCLPQSGRQRQKLRHSVPGKKNRFIHKYTFVWLTWHVCISWFFDTFMIVNVLGGSTDWHSEFFTVIKESFLLNWLMYIEKFFYVWLTNKKGKYQFMSRVHVDYWMRTFHWFLIMVNYRFCWIVNVQTGQPLTTSWERRTVKFLNSSLVMMLIATNWTPSKSFCI